MSTGTWRTGFIRDTIVTNEGDGMEKKIILIAGMSGAGKSTVMSILEDMGYQCIDQLPSPLLQDFVQWLEHTEDTRYQNVALSTNIIDLASMYRLLKASNLFYRSMFLDASDEQILLRYKFTKHKHPMLLLGRARTLEDAIAMERSIFADMQEFNSIFVDTTNLTHIELKRKVEEYFSAGLEPGFTVSFISFGYKYGIPKDADLLFDVRFLPNPYWEGSLRSLTGDDKAVYDYVIQADMTQEYLRKLCSFLDYLLPMYQKEGRYHMVVGIGCTGGQHRSISIVNYLYDHYRKEYRCLKEHRNQKERTV